MKKIILSLIVAMATWANTNACSCMPTGSYLCESFQNDTFVKLVCLCRKIDTMAYGFKVQRLYNYYGTETRDTFWVWGDNGALCRLYDSWNIGDSILLALQVCDTMGNQVHAPEFPPNLERPEDYQVSGCGSYAAFVVNGSIIGYINDPDIENIPLTDFAQNNCLQRNTTGIPAIDESAFRVYPTLVNSTLSINNALADNLIITIYNSNGALQTTTTINSGTTQLNVGQLPAGTYTLHTQYNHTGISRRFVVMP